MWMKIDKKKKDPTPPRLYSFCSIFQVPLHLLRPPGLFGTEKYFRYFIVYVRVKQKLSFKKNWNCPHISDTI